MLLYLHVFVFAICLSKRQLNINRLWDVPFTVYYIHFSLKLHRLLALFIGYNTAFSLVKQCKVGDSLTLSRCIFALKHDSTTFTW